MYVKRVIMEKRVCILAIVTDGIGEEKVIDEIAYLIENQFGEGSYKYQFFLD